MSLADLRFLGRLQGRAKTDADGRHTQMDTCLGIVSPLFSIVYDNIAEVGLLFISTGAKPTIQPSFRGDIAPATP